MKSKWKEALCFQQHVAFKKKNNNNTASKDLSIWKFTPEGPDTPWNGSSNAKMNDTAMPIFSRPHQTRGEDVDKICEANKVRRSVFCAERRNKGVDDILK